MAALRSGSEGKGSTLIMKRKSFTLLEMLVVIAIMCILVALLGPAYAQVRATASLTKCLNNKKHLAAAMTLYANENDGTVIYKGKDYTYADVMAGKFIGNKRLTKEYMPTRELRCSLAKENALDANATNVTGMLNALSIANYENTSTTIDSNCWIESASKYDTGVNNYDVHGRFAKIVDTNTKGDSVYGGVFYLLDRMREPAELVLFADTFKVVSGGATDGTSFWSFIPDKGDNDAAVTMVHRNRAAVSFADGHADSMDRGKLKDSKTGITVFADDEFKKDDWSDAL